MSNMFKCFVDCADFDLVNDCASTDQAEVARTQQPRRSAASHERGLSSGGDGNYAVEGDADAASEEGSQYSSEGERSYSRSGSWDEEEDVVAPDAGQGTGEHADGLANASRQSTDPLSAPGTASARSQKAPLTSLAPGSRGVSGSLEKASYAPLYGGVPGGVSPPGLHGGDLQALSVNAARVARGQKSGDPNGSTTGVMGGGDNSVVGTSVEEASAASAAATAAAEAGRRASSSAADAVAAAAAAADARTQEEAELAADRAAKAAASAAAGAAGAARAAKEAGKAAAAEQAALDSMSTRAPALYPPTSGGTAITPPSPVDVGKYKTGDQTPEMSPRGVGRGGAPGDEPAESAGGWDGSAQGAYRRSASLDAESAPLYGGARSLPGRLSEPGFRSTPGANEIQAAATPGREEEGERTWLMARRVASTWGEQVPTEPAPIPRTFVSTRLRHLRLSPDGSTLVVKSEKGGVDHELALDELLEVHETPAEESVTLMGRDIEIRIAFKGQAKALKQFRNMLVPAGSNNPGANANTTTNTTSGDNPTTTTVTTIEENPDASSEASQNNPAGGGGEVTMPTATAGTEVGGGKRSDEPSGYAAAGTSDDGAGGSGAVSRGMGSTVAQGYLDRDAHPSQQLEGIDEDSAAFSHQGPQSAQLSRNMISSNSSIVSPASTASGWGSVMGKPAGPGTQRQLAALSERTEGSGTDLAGVRDRASSTGGSTFADARERERVIAALQNSQDTMSPVEREAKLHLVKYEQAGFVRGYEALCDQQQVRLRKRPEFSELESVGVAEGLANPSIVLQQPNPSKSVDVHYADAVRAKAALDELLEEVILDTPGLWVRSVPVKEKESIKRKATNDYGGEVRRVLDMARTSVICETPELVRLLTDRLKICPGVGHIGRMKNGFGSTAVGRGGYRDIKVNLQPANLTHYVEVQVHLREFYELNSRSHEVYEWARGVDLPEGTTPHLLFRNLSPEVQAEMTKLVKEDWMGLRRILPELLQATEQFSEAEPLLRQNVEDAEKRWVMAKNRFGEGHLHEMSCAQGVAMALNNLALALKGRGDTQGAEPLLRRALQMSIDAQGAEHPEVATRLNSLALLLASDGRVEEAEELHRRALEIARKVYGPEHADVATYLNNLARVLKAQDKLQEAEPLQRSALAIGERMLGTNHSDVATYYNNLSRLVRAAGKLEEAEPLQRRAVEIGEQVLGPNSPDLATWVNNLGRLLMARKKLAEAEVVQERAVAIAENVYGPEHSQVARARKNLTKVRWALGKAARGRAPSANRAYEA